MHINCETGLGCKEKAIEKFVVHAHKLILVKVKKKEKINKQTNKQTNKKTNKKDE